jgi:hypothetical protein
LKLTARVMMRPSIQVDQQNTLLAARALDQPGRLVAQPARISGAFVGLVEQVIERTFGELGELPGDGVAREGADVCRVRVALLDGGFAAGVHAALGPCRGPRVTLVIHY